MIARVVPVALVLVAVGACDVLRVEPAVWLPVDGLPVPSAVESRGWLPFCGVMGEDGGADADGRVALCLHDANRLGLGAEAVLLYGDHDRPNINIVRSLPGGGLEQYMRFVSGLDGSVQWEVETCAGIAGDATTFVRVPPCSDSRILGGGG